MRTPSRPLQLLAAALMVSLAAGCDRSRRDTAPAPGPQEPEPPATETPPPDEPEVPPPPQGAPCTPEGSCAEGLTCLRYHGIAGTRGPEFTSCEIPCMNRPEVCPEGQRCVVIADGPGQVCRPTRGDGDAGANGEPGDEAAPAPPTR